MSDQDKSDGQVVPIGEKRRKTAIATRSSSWTEPGWLEGWRASEPVPATAEEVDRCLTACRMWLIPATEKQITDALKPLVTMFGAPAEFEAKIPLYRSTLAIPVDLLARGVFACLRDLSYFPYPGTIRAQIADELSRRNHTIRRLETALRLADRQRKSA